MISDIKLDIKTNDLLFEGNDLALFTSIEESIRQRLKIGLSLVKGEWFLDTSKGLPVTSKEFSQKGSQTIVDAYIKRFISQFEGVEELLSYNSELDRPSRVATITFSARISTGTILSFTEEI